MQFPVFGKTPVVSLVLDETGSQDPLFIFFTDDTPSLPYFRSFHLPSRVPRPFETPWLKELVLFSPLGICLWLSWSAKSSVHCCPVSKIHVWGLRLPPDTTFYLFQVASVLILVNVLQVQRNRFLCSRISVNEPVHWQQCSVDPHHAVQLFAGFSCRNGGWGECSLQH